jgi:hypothetical protein
MLSAEFSERAGLTLWVRMIEMRRNVLRLLRATALTPLVQLEAA